MKKKIMIIACILIIGLFAYHAGSTSEILGPYEVIRIVDGDTIVVSIDGEETKVRLIGVDTPESVSYDKSENTKEGIEASSYTTELLEGHQVYLEYDEQRTDVYDRVLAYVYLEDKETMVNKVLLQEGLAQVMTVEPNTRYQSEFEKLEEEARQANIGFWETGYFSIVDKKLLTSDKFCFMMDTVIA